MLTERSSRLLEPELKSLVINQLIQKNIICENDTIFNEFTVDQASRRVDLAITKGDELWAFEIKSEADSLVRLKGQIDIYLRYFDKVFVIAASKHINAAKEIIPPTVALWEVKNEQVVVRQRGRKKLIKDPSIFIEMMDVSALKKLTNRNKLKVPTKRRADLVSASYNLKPPLLRKAAFENITKKYKLTSQLFFKQTKNRKITPDDIQLLSRYKQIDSQVDSEQDCIESIISTLNTLNHYLPNKLNI